MAPAGAGDAIPSRAEYALSQAEFDRRMPTEFWREVVDRVAAEVPGTLLLAEAFWMLEGYFVRTLGMHRVYNSAFMHMLRDEDGPGYRKVLKETLEFDPEILKRYVNFMSNPDEKTAVEQFGKGDKYFGVASMMATLPGLPMLGHGQVEGFGEKYGMEFRRAVLDEQPDPWLLERHRRELFPLFHRRAWFAEAADFLLYDVVTPIGCGRRGRLRLLERLGSDADARPVSRPVRRDDRHDPRIRGLRAADGERREAPDPPEPRRRPGPPRRSERVRDVPRCADRPRIRPLVYRHPAARPDVRLRGVRGPRLLGVP